MKYTEFKNTEDGIDIRFADNNTIEEDYMDLFGFVASSGFKLVGEMLRKQEAGENVFPYQYASPATYLLRLTEDLARRVAVDDADCKFLKTIWFACGNREQVAETLASVKGVVSISMGFAEGEVGMPFRSLTGKEIHGKTPGIKVVYDALCISAEEIIGAFLDTIKAFGDSGNAKVRKHPYAIFYGKGLSCHCMEANKKLVEMNSEIELPIPVTIQSIKAFYEE